MKLGVNIDHIATLRQARQSLFPDPVIAAAVCEASGADSIVVHLREDRRHIQDRDVELLRTTVRTKLNLEMSIAEEIVAVACRIQPDQATLVPEKRRELTTEGGLDVTGNDARLKVATGRLRKRGIAVSIFIDPDKKQIAHAAHIGVTMIELHTGRYAQAQSASARRASLAELSEAAQWARRKKLQVFAGHGLDYENASGILAIREIEELNIGYAIVCRAVMVGLAQAVREMKGLVDPGRDLML
jgi:pyridoxine 5-phosphate synthase